MKKYHKIETLFEEDIAKAFNIPVAPIVITGTMQEGVDYIKPKPKPIISKIEHELEELVGKPITEMFDR